MELDELKNRWSSLEEQLKKQEILTEKLIWEIRQSKSGPLRYLINYSYFGIAMCVLAIPFLIYVYTHSYFAAFKTFLFVFAGIMLLFGLITGIYNISHLKKIDFTQSVSKNIQLVQTHIVNLKKQLICGYIIAVIFVILVIISLLSVNMDTWRWGTIGIAILVGGILSYLEYKKIYKTKTKAILKSLEELKELEE